MKKLLLLVLLLPCWVSAQNLPPFDTSKMPSKADLQKMMQQAQSMSACMARIDQSALKAVQKEAEAVGDEIEALCAKGDSDAALDRAIKYSRKIRNEPVVIELQGCAKDMSAFLPDFSSAAVEAKAEQENYDICD